MGMNPLRSLVVALGYLLSGHIHFAKEHVGRELTLHDGQRVRAFRQIVVRPGPGQPSVAGATFVVRFHVAGMSLRQNIRFSWLPIPFFIGLRGFRSKIWAYSPENGDFLGIYEWQTIQDAENYACSFALWFMMRRSVPGSVSYTILPANRLAAFGF